MVQNRTLELLQGQARLETELVGECTPPVAIDIERFGLTANLVEGEHELAAQPLAQRVRANERLELGNHGASAAQREIGVDPLLGCLHSELLQACDLPASELLVGEVGQRRAAPQPERLGQHGLRGFGLTSNEQRPTLTKEPFERARVELVMAKLERVPATVRGQSPAAKGLTELRHVDVDAVRRAGRWPLAPQRVD